ncbi:Uncharacterised protein [Neisseria meningitidis]|uniref:Uncharacterized protein n=1 Tax=Neisseria meningitidis TaxID=487 RepID=A0AB33TXL3_NEIME|nr:Uncharacterised protein [Neisseria meningitidis]CWN20115.1 Uncharacterised protein [Neisseria meningitidis]CWQ05088.1 Uncharacterised protein [Neisseria meningitidis]CWQ48741.1 Uncharacterised protein [Neisseria meningitidis]
MGSASIRFSRLRKLSNCPGVSHKPDWGERSQTCDQENAAACRGDSEICCIKHAPKSHIPALGKGLDDFLKVFAIV